MESGWRKRIGNGEAGARAAIWTASGLSVFGAPGSLANDINNLGQVVGNIDVLETESNRAWPWTGGTTIDLNSFLSQADVAAVWTLESANAINDHGWITGSAYNALQNTRYAYLLSVVPAVPEARSLWLMLAGLGVIGWASKRSRDTRPRGPAAACAA